MINIFRVIFFILMTINIFAVNNSDSLNYIKRTNNYVYFGDIQINLCKIDGMTECYNNLNVKNTFNNFEYKDNEILAIYLNNKTYEHKNELNEITFDDYLKIYSVKQLKGIYVNKDRLEQLSSVMKNNFVKKNWNDLKYEIERNQNQFSVGEPVLIEDYQFNTNIYTFVFLMKVKTEINENIIIMTINMVLIKNRLIYYAYYKNYEDLKSIKQAKSKNDYFGFKLLEKN